MASVDKYTIKAGTRWRVRYTTPDGKRHAKRGFKTKASAQAWVAQNFQEIENGKLHTTTTAPTISELWGQYKRLELKYLAPTSQQSLETCYRVHVKPRWGEFPADTITRPDLTEWVYTLASKRSASLVQRAVSLVHKLLNYAKEGGHIDVNHAARLPLPPKRAKAATPLTGEQLIRLADNAGRYRSLLLFMGTTGARLGECAALTPSDIDEKHARATISKSISYIGAKPVLGTTKTGRVRRVAIPAPTLAAVLESIGDKGSNEFIWERPQGGPVTNPGKRGWWSKAIKESQKQDPTFPRLSMHDLRHTAASLMIQAGCSVLVVQRQLGHSSAKMTLDVYSHLFDSDLDAVADLLS
ncbi:hypothetical protein CARG_02430 [Corynebacterium argentoratense DSM 44202]|uniref:Integrase n=1 Tax=Corynebacterium argentoratense DSM 44202 TaxID=1348662 RepID=U3GW25_9CORY|nr:site-specific integrase [Corynebacterium argentoratense]AGU14648.1 hypothetical protein CARG_02430 [Corynebacterium argentoratense DSM 44202]